MLPSTAHISEEIRTIYRRETDNGQMNIEMYLESLLDTLSGLEKLDILQEISEEFVDSTVSQPLLSTDAGNQLLRFISLLLGRQVDVCDVADQQLQEKLCTSLNTIFDALNDLLEAINSTLNRGDGFEETIRHVLRKQLDEPDDGQTLDTYIDQIRKSFFMSYESFKGAHMLIIDKVLEELSPANSRSKCAGGLKLGVLRKAEAFDHYTQLYESLRDWHKSGRGLEEYLRVFEKQCRGIRGSVS